MPNAAGRATRERLILAAERLFAERGVEAVPLREVAIAAGQRNVAATNYYFTDREGLLRAIFDYRLETVERRQEELLQATLGATGPGEPARLRGLIEAYTLPLVDQLESGYFLGFIARTQLDLGRGDQYVADQWMRGLRLISGLLRSELPHLSDAAFATRINSMVLLGVHYLATFQLHSDAMDGIPLAVDDLIDILVAVIAAPSTTADGQQPPASPDKAPRRARKAEPRRRPRVRG